MAQHTKEEWTWDTEAPMIELFAAEQARLEYLEQKSPLTQDEAKELDKGAPPFAYVGTTYHGHPIHVVLADDGSGDRTPYVLNDMNQWSGPAFQPLSTTHWPDGPPGWQKLVVGVHFETSTALDAIHHRLAHLQLPFDVEFQAILDHGALLGM